MSNVNLRPEINLNVVNTNARRVTEFPEGTFSKRSGTALPSRQWGYTPFFTNAKGASMLERGWVRAIGQLKPRERGLFVDKDGSEEEVQVLLINYKKYPERGRIFTFVDKDGKLFDKGDEDRFERWDFYYPTEPVKFVPRKGGKKTRKIKKRNTRRKA